MKKKLTNTQIIIRVTSVTLLANVLLAILKSIVGLVFFNVSVLSDAAHSIADVVTSALVIVAVFLSSPKPDKKHNYGHEKMEYIVLLFFSFILFGLAGLFIWQGVDGIISPLDSNIHWMLIGVTVLSIIIKEAIFWFTMHFAKKVNSEIMKADAWHSRFDGLSSVAVLIGLIVSIFIGNNLAESIAVLIVALFIIKIAYEVFKKAIDQLTDKAASQEVSDKIREIALSVDGVVAIDDLKTRLFGSSILADIEIAVDGKLSVEESHQIAQSVHDLIEADKGLGVKHCNVHVNPAMSSRA
ncbi:MAG: cation diffusion facilitator family transporter [Firmicutes bacterium]|nr:cation diffusion facilitator family transporter [Bacillota bacterium]